MMRSVPCVEELVESARPDVGRSANGVAVSIRLPSCAVVANYEPDLIEHERRLRAGVGAVVDTAVLSSLWSLPGGVDVPADSVDGSMLARERGSKGLVVDRGAGLVRREFEPCGAVDALFVVARSADVALRRASLLSPIYERSAVITGPVDVEDWERVHAIAARCGVGVVVPGHAGLSAAPSRPVRGRPHVFRWWMVELAYASWLSRGAPTS